MNMHKTHWLKFIVGWIVCFAIRLLPYRPPNIEPILATTMPFGRRFGVLGGFVFASLSIALFDLVTSGLGIWTAVSALTYGFIGSAAALYLRGKRGTRWQYAVFAIIATIAYDLITGVLLGPVLFGGSMYQAFIGQIPFTANHLLGNILLAIIASPLIDEWVVRNQRLEFGIPVGSTTHS